MNQLNSRVVLQVTIYVYMYVYVYVERIGTFAMGRRLPNDDVIGGF